MRVTQNNGIRPDDVNDGVCLVKFKGRDQVEWFEADTYELGKEWLDLDTIDGRASSMVRASDIEWFKFEPRVKTNKPANK